MLQVDSSACSHSLKMQSYMQRRRAGSDDPMTYVTRDSLCPRAGDVQSLTEVLKKQTDGIGSALKIVEGHGCSTQRYIAVRAGRNTLEGDSRPAPQ